MVPLTEEDLARIEALALASSDGGLAVGSADPRYRPIDWMLECLAHGGGSVYCVARPAAERNVVCVTGNGPTSEANARFFSIARHATLALVAEVRRLHAERGST